jgi:P-type Cu+ transporter
MKSSSELQSTKPDTTSSGSIIDLALGGMTCSSCAVRIERKLNKVPGVVATVNYATERATISLPEGVTVDDAIEVIKTAGYFAEPVLDLAVSDDIALGVLRRRLVWSAVLSIPVIAMAMIPAFQFPYWQWISLVMATVVVWWGGWPFHRAALINLRHGTTTMDTLVSMGVTAAYVWSLYALIWGGAGDPDMRMAFHLLPMQDMGEAQIYFEVSAGVITFLLLGRYLEGRAKVASGDALRTLMSQGAKEVTIIRDGTEIRLPIAELGVGMEFVVRPGEKIATDGVIRLGTSSVDSSLITGESMPVQVQPGELVTGATVNVDGLITVEATRIGADTQLAQMARLVAAAQSGKAPVQRLADRVSAVFVPIVLVIALVTLSGWLLAGAGANFAFTAAVSVLIIACPCALGLATPTALLVGTGRAARMGIIIKGPQILESTRQVDAMILDKTGTITTGRLSVTDVVPFGGGDRAELLRLAAGVEAGSEHPIGVAVVLAAEEAGTTVPRVTDFRAHGGWGVEGTVDDRVLEIGRPVWLIDQRSVVVSLEATTAIEHAQAEGSTVVAIASEGQLLGFIALSDSIKDSSAEAIAELTAMGIEPMLVTGDNLEVANRVAAQVGITQVFAEVTPQGKVDAVRELQAAGRYVGMAGDGVNDAAALAQADLGIAMGTGTDVAIEASDITIVTGDLRSVVSSLRISQRTLRIIKGNLFWAFAYNVAMIPLAAAGLMNPMLAGAAMAFSSVFVVMNSLRLRR